MPTYPTKKETVYEPIDAGTYIARCYQFTHIGTVPVTFDGRVTDLNKIRFGFELPTELKVFKEENGEQPRTVWTEYTNSVSKKAKLNAVLKSWIGVEPDENFDLESLVGKPCMIGVSVLTRNGKTFNEVTSISQLPKGTVCPPQINPSQILTYDNFNMDIYENLPKFIKEKIQSSKEYQNMMGIKAKSYQEITDTEIPF